MHNTQKKHNKISTEKGFVYYVYKSIHLLFIYLYFTVQIYINKYMFPLFTIIIYQIIVLQ